MSWIWLTSEMLDSPAWRAMGFVARKLLDRILAEHMNHSGTRNGALKVTYSDFVAYGIRRGSIASGIEELRILGFIDLVKRGYRSHAEIRVPSEYGLTWLDRADETHRSNRWKKYKNLGEALEAKRLAVIRKKPVTKVIPARVTNPSLVPGTNLSLDSSKSLESLVTETIPLSISRVSTVQETTERAANSNHVDLDIPEFLDRRNGRIDPRTRA